jgi:hypothetical protein
VAGFIFLRLDQPVRPARGPGNGEDYAFQFQPGQLPAGMPDEDSRQAESQVSLAACGRPPDPAQSCGTAKSEFS